MNDLKNLKAPHQERMANGNEIKSHATVRKEKTLSEKELKFLKDRKVTIVAGFAKYLEVPISEVLPEDIPTVGIGFSGGGIRAVIDGSAAIATLKSMGIYDIATYTACVSGGAIAMTLFHTLAKQDPDTLHKHMEGRIGSNELFVRTSVMRDILGRPHGVSRILGGIQEKIENNVPVTVIDLFLSLALGWMFTPVKRGIDAEWLKLTNQDQLTANGASPMPLYLTTRLAKPYQEGINPNSYPLPGHDLYDSYQENYEFSPYEFGCENWGWIPSYSVGRKFMNWESVNAIPEANLISELLFVTSAPAAPIRQYYDELDFSGKGLFASLLSKVVNCCERLLPEELGERLADKEVFRAAVMPNPYCVSSPNLPPGNGFLHDAYISLSDSYVFANVPIIPFLRHDRVVDVQIQLDFGTPYSPTMTLQKELFDKITAVKGMHFFARDLNLFRRFQDDTQVKVETLGAQGIAKTYEGQYCIVFDGIPHPQIGPHSEALSQNTPTTICYLPQLPHFTNPDFNPLAIPTSRLEYDVKTVQQLTNNINATISASAQTIKNVIRESWIKKKEARLKGVNTMRNEE